MGLFKFFKNRKVKTDRVTEPGIKTLGENALLDRQVRESFIEGNCETIVSADKQIMESRKEYDVVTSYLSDIQKIDMISQNEREEINESANRILNLNKERLAMQHTPPKITMAQRLAIEPLVDTMDDEIKQLGENEAYRNLVNKDLEILEEERDSLDEAIERCISKTEFSRKLLTVATVFIILSLIFLIVVGQMTRVDTTYVYALIILFGAACAAYFIVFYRRSVGDLNTNKLKMDRAITLINRTKIKYVNVTNVLDYKCEKFHVRDVEELKYNWKEYNRIVEEEKRFKKAEQLIDFYNDDLKGRLKTAGVSDTGIWIYQCEALVDPNEMVEVRHRLNVRRQKLRKVIDYNNEQKKFAILSIKGLVEKHPEFSQETSMIMDRYRLTIS